MQAMSYSLPTNATAQYRPPLLKGTLVTLYLKDLLPGCVAGAFQVEMYRDSHKDRTILCRYDPTECGLYIISVRWSGVDVPGSPFQVHIVDSQADLERILQSTAYGNSSVNSGSRSYLGYQGSQYNGYGQTMLRDEI